MDPKRPAHSEITETAKLALAALEDSLSLQTIKDDQLVSNLNIIAGCLKNWPLEKENTMIDARNKRSQQKTLIGMAQDYITLLNQCLESEEGSSNVVYRAALLNTSTLLANGFDLIDKLKGPNYLFGQITHAFAPIIAVMAEYQRVVQPCLIKLKHAPETKEIYTTGAIFAVSLLERANQTFSERFKHFKQGNHALYTEEEKKLNLVPEINQLGGILQHVVYAIKEPAQVRPLEQAVNNYGKNVSSSVSLKWQQFKDCVNKFIAKLTGSYRDTAAPDETKFSEETKKTQMHASLKKFKPVNQISGDDEKKPVISPASAPIRTSRK